MHALLIPLLALAGVQDAPVSPTPGPVSIPTSVQSWNAMRPEQRSRYVRVTIQALRRSPAFAACKALDADVLEIKISELVEEGSPLIMAVAAAAYAICEDTPAG